MSSPDVSRCNSTRAASACGRWPRRWTFWATSCGRGTGWCAGGGRAFARGAVEGRGTVGAQFDSVANANRVLDKLTELAASLAKFPARGTYPKALLSLGVKE